jgi:hypothetical protein
MELKQHLASYKWWRRISRNFWRRFKSTGEKIFDYLPTLDDNDIIDLTTQALGAALPAHTQFNMSELNRDFSFNLVQPEDDSSMELQEVIIAAAVVGEAAGEERLQIFPKQAIDPGFTPPSSCSSISENTRIQTNWSSATATFSIPEAPPRSRSRSRIAVFDERTRGSTPVGSHKVQSNVAAKSSGKAADVEVVVSANPLVSTASQSLMPFVSDSQVASANSARSQTSDASWSISAAENLALSATLRSTPPITVSGSTQSLNSTLSRPVLNEAKLLIVRNLRNHMRKSNVDDRNVWHTATTNSSPLISRDDSPMQVQTAQIDTHDSEVQHSFCSEAHLASSNSKNSSILTSVHSHLQNAQIEHFDNRVDVLQRISATEHFMPPLTSSHLQKVHKLRKILLNSRFDGHDAETSPLKAFVGVKYAGPPHLPPPLGRFEHDDDSKLPKAIEAVPREVKAAAVATQGQRLKATAAASSQPGRRKAFVGGEIAGPPPLPPLLDWSEDDDDSKLPKAIEAVPLEVKAAAVATQGQRLKATAAASSQPRLAQA